MNQELPEPTLSGLEVTLFGPLAASVLNLLNQRYDQVTADSAGIVVTIADIDQAGERAVLTLLWDTGHQVRSVRRRSR
ncbi:hypothetical protein [Kribbella sp. NPDC055071]